MADVHKLEQIEAHVAQLQNALDHVQTVLHDVGTARTGLRRAVSLLRFVVISLAIGATAYAVVSAIRNANRPV